MSNKATTDIPREGVAKVKLLHKPFKPSTHGAVSKNSKTHKALIDYLKKQSKSFNQIAQIPKFTALSLRLTSQDFCLDTTPFQSSSTPSTPNPKSAPPGRPQATANRNTNLQNSDPDWREQLDEAQKRDRELEVRLLDAAQEQLKSGLSAQRQARIRSVMTDYHKLQRMKQFLANPQSKEYFSYVLQKFEVCRSELNTKLIQQTVRDCAAKYPNEDVQKEYQRRIERLNLLKNYYLAACSPSSLIDFFSRIAPDGSLEWLDGDGKYKKNKLSDRIRDKYGISAKFGVFDIIEEIKESDTGILAIPASLLKNRAGHPRGSVTDNPQGGSQFKQPRGSKSSSYSSEDKEDNFVLKQKAKPIVQTQSKSDRGIVKLGHRKSKSVKLPKLSDRRPSAKAIDYEEAEFDERVFDPRYIDQMVKTQLDEVYNNMLGGRLRNYKAKLGETSQQRLEKLHKSDQAFVGDSTMKIVENQSAPEAVHKEDQNPGSVGEQSYQPDVKEPEGIEYLRISQPLYSNTNSIINPHELHKGKMQSLFQLNKTTSNVSNILKSENTSGEQTPGAEMSLENNPKIIFSKGNSFAITKNAKEHSRSASEAKKPIAIVMNLSKIPESVDLEKLEADQDGDRPKIPSRASNSKLVSPDNKHRKFNGFRGFADVNPQSFLGVPGIPAQHINQSYTSLPRPPSKDHMPIDIHRQQIEAITSYDGLEELQKHEMMVKLREKYSYLIDSSSSLPKRRLMAKSTYLKPFFSSRYKVLKRANQTVMAPQDMNDFAEDEPTTALIEYRIPQTSSINGLKNYNTRSSFYSGEAIRANDGVSSHGEDTEISGNKLNIRNLVDNHKLLTHGKKRLTNPAYFMSRSLSKIAKAQTPADPGMIIPGFATFYTSYNSMIPQLNELSEKFRLEDRRLTKLTRKMQGTTLPSNQFRPRPKKQQIAKADVMLDELQ
jgi:hypothetical protein